MSVRLTAVFLLLALAPAAHAQDSAETVTYRCGKATLAVEFMANKAKITMANGRVITLPGRKGEKRFQYLDRSFEFSGTPDAPVWQAVTKQPVSCVPLSS